MLLGRSVIGAPRERRWQVPVGSDNSRPVRLRCASFRHLSKGASAMTEYESRSLHYLSRIEELLETLIVETKKGTGANEGARKYNSEDPLRSHPPACRDRAEGEGEAVRKAAVSTDDRE